MCLHFSAKSRTIRGVFTRHPACGTPAIESILGCHTAYYRGMVSNTLNTYLSIFYLSLSLCLSVYLLPPMNFPSFFFSSHLPTISLPPSLEHHHQTRSSLLSARSGEAQWQSHWQPNKLHSTEMTCRRHLTIQTWLANERQQINGKLANWIKWSNSATYCTCASVCPSVSVWGCYVHSCTQCYNNIKVAKERCNAYVHILNPIL